MPHTTNEILNITGTIRRIYEEPVHTIHPFPDIASMFSDRPGTVVLLSGGDLDCSRYHILGVNPWIQIQARDKKVFIQAGGRQLKLNTDPFEILKALIEQYRLPEDLSFFPLKSGFLGYLAYDLKDQLENLPRTSVDDLCLPHMFMVAPSIIVVQDNHTGIIRLFIPELSSSGERAVLENRNDFFQTMAAKSPNYGIFEGAVNGFKSDFSKAGYMAAIEQIKEYISAGHVYQVNMSQRFETDFSGDAFSLFKRLYDLNPAPFFAYIHAGTHQIVSTSPERFICRNGSVVETRPIKGTRPRGKTRSEDEQLCRDLLSSRKDDAELSMIVDLLRNDIGKVCQAASVRVKQHRKLEAYQNVYHLVSVVEGMMDEGKDSVDLIRAVFPGGSITGCPKIRSMEIIDELEPVRRHIYTGSIGYISFHDTLDLSIAIRTATIINNKMVFSVGGGIVFDSDPMDEYRETLHKGRTLLDIFKNKTDKKQIPSRVWINGQMKPSDQASIPIDTPGFQYGFGFFETIRVSNGKPEYLQDHLNRFNRAWESFFPYAPPDVTWPDIIHGVIEQNDLSHTVAAVKIMAVRGKKDSAPYDDHIIVMARGYTHRLEGKRFQGLAIVTHPEPRQSPLADHKTMNYLYYYLAGKQAMARGADEALILNPDGSVSETHTANLLAVRNKTVFLPASPHVLPGIMQQAVCRKLEIRGYTIEITKIMPADLFDMDDVILTNSLMGAVPVLKFDGRSLKHPSDLWKCLNKEISGRLIPEIEK